MILPLNLAQTAPTEDILYEVVNGEIRELPPKGANEVNLASTLGGNLNHFARERKLGRAVVEMLFKLFPDDSPQRRPDVAFVSFARWPGPVPKAEAWEVVPDLAVEVVSKSNTAEVLTKIHEYFKAGVQRVWVIYPDFEQVHVYRSPSSVSILNRPDTLDGEHVLLDFRLPVAALFE